jgi:MFS family permease
VSQSNYRWAIVALGGLMGCVALGAMFTLPVFVTPVSTETGWSHAGISFAMTIALLVLAFGSFIWGAASDRWGARVVTLCGSVLLGLALVFASRADSLLEFQLAFGIPVGLAASAFFAPMIATVTGWFETHRNLAVSLVSVGMGMAPLTMSPLAGWLTTHYGWRAAMFYVGVLAWAVLIPASLFVRRPPPVPDTANPAQPARASKEEVGKALTSMPFLVLGFTFMFCCAAHSGPIFHVISYAEFCGLGTMAAVHVYMAEGLAGLGGRVLVGLLADKFGAKRVLVSMLVLQSLVIAAYLNVREAYQFYTLGVMFGIAYGGGMPLYASLARDYFGQHIMGTVFGAATMLSALGMSVGPWFGGWVFDSFHNYAWLYIASAGVAVGAVLLATLFPRPVLRMAQT